MSSRRIVIGGTDVTDVVAAIIAAAPPLTVAQREVLAPILAPTPAELAARTASAEQTRAAPRRAPRLPRAA